MNIPKLLTYLHGVVSWRFFHLSHFNQLKNLRQNPRMLQLLELSLWVCPSLSLFLWNLTTQERSNINNYDKNNIFDNKPSYFKFIERCHYFKLYLHSFYTQQFSIWISWDSSFSANDTTARIKILFQENLKSGSFWPSQNRGTFTKGIHRNFLTLWFVISYTNFYLICNKYLFHHLCFDGGHLKTSKCTTVCFIFGVL